MLTANSEWELLCHVPATVFPGANEDHIIYYASPLPFDNASQTWGWYQLSQGSPDCAWTRLVCTPTFPPWLHVGNPGEGMAPACAITDYITTASCPPRCRALSTMTLDSPNDSCSIFENGRLKPGIYKIQNLHSQTYLDIHEHSREMCCRPARDLEEGTGLVRPISNRLRFVYLTIRSGKSCPSRLDILYRG